MNNMSRVEPMDLDCIESDFDNKENTFHINNALPRSSSTEKRLENLDVSEVNMKLRCSIIQGSSSMSKSFTANYIDGKNISLVEDHNIVNSNSNLTRSLNSTLDNFDGLLKSPKSLPLQSRTTGQCMDLERNMIVNESFHASKNNIKVNIDPDDTENLSLPSTYSSLGHTPEATTPTKEIPKDGGSPIMRGLKSVFSMFRSSQSPIQPVRDQDSENEKKDHQEAPLHLQTVDSKPQTEIALASTPIKNKKSKSNSPLKDSVTFNDDLERELQWKEDSAVFFKDEKVPLHILFPTITSSNVKPAISNMVQEDQNISVEYMDISLNETITADNVKRIEQKDTNTESDCEFQDCETTINNSEAENIKGNEPLTAKDLSKDNNIDMTGLEFGNKAVASSETESKQCSLQEKCLIESGNSLNTELIKNKDGESKVTDLFKENIINIDPHLNSDVMNEYSNRNTMAGTNLQNTELAIKLNETIDIETYLDTEDLGLGSSMIENVNTEVIVESIPQNIGFDNEPIKLNKTIDIDSHLGTGDSLDMETVDKLYKSHSVEGTLEPKPQQIVSEIEEETLNGTVDIESSLDTEDILSPEIKQKAVEESNIDAVNLNETHIKTFSSNEDILDINVVKNINTIINADSGVSTITTRIGVNNDNVQVNLIEASVEQDFTENYTQPKCDFPCNKKEYETKLTEGLDYTTAIIDNETSEKINQKSVLPDVVQSNDKSEFIIKGEEIINHSHDIEIVNKSDINCMNVEKLESQSMLHDNTIIIKEQMIDHFHNDINEAKNVIDKHDFKKSDNLQFIQAGSTESANTSIESQNVVIKSLTISVEDNKSLTMNKHGSDLNNQTQTSSQQNPVPISEPFHEAKIETSEHNIVEESVCFQSDILNENQKLALSNKTSCTDVMNDHSPQEDFEFHSSYTEIEQATLSKEEYESSSSNKEGDIPAEKEVLKSTVDLSNDENLVCTKLSISKLTAAEDNNHSEDNLNKNVDTITDLKTDHNVEINAMKLSDSSPTIIKEYNKINEEAFEIDCTESQQILCKPNKLDLDDLEVENINKSQSPGTVTVENSFKTKSKLLKTPPSSPKIESKGYNFNFDEIEDPFATKTKVRSSPPPTSPVNNICTPIEINNKSNRKNLLQNKRKSQPLPKKQNVCKKKMNSTFNETVLDVKENDNINLNETQPIEPHQNTDNVFNQIEIKKDENESNIDAQVVNTKDSQKYNIVINDKSCELNVSYDVNKKNVFNLPEIDDRNFSPFSTRTKVCLTPPLVNNTFHLDDIETLDSDKNNATTVMVNNEDSKETPVDSNYIELSRHDDKTLKEVNTEDEDTIEGPFLELEDLGEIEKGDKLLNDEKHDYMTFDDFPKQQTDEAENEMFIDAEAFEFLLNQHQTNVVADSGKESLFLKFDPLFAKRVSSDGILAALSNFQKKQSTPKKEKQPSESYLYAETTDTFPSCSKNVPTLDHNDESVVNNITKPTMVVNPAVISPRKAATPPKINRQSLTFTSPAMAVIDKLLSLSGNTSTSLCHDTSLPQCYSEQHHTDVALTQLREMLAEKEMHVQVLRNERKELSSRLGALESQVKTLEYESEDRLRKIKDLNNELSEKNKQNKTMATVVEEYERTIATLVAELEQDKKRHAEERMRLIRDRDEQTAHLASMEISFNDLHSKYEKSKQIILSLKANEDCLKKSLQDFADNQLKIQNNYELLKQHATAKLNHANQELEKLNKGHEAEVLKLKAMMKRKDMHISSLEETLAQKTKANEELTAICDELINKVG